MADKTKVVQGKRTKNHSAPTIEEILEEFNRPPEGYTARELASMFNRSTDWVMQNLIHRGYFAFAGEKRIIGVAGRRVVTFLYQITDKGKRELKTFLRL